MSFVFLPLLGWLIVDRLKTVFTGQPLPYPGASDDDLAIVGRDCGLHDPPQRAPVADECVKTRREPDCPAPNSATASNMAMMFSGGTSARMLWTCWKTKPPPGPRMRDLLA